MAHSLIFLALSLAAKTVHGERPFINEPDTGLDTFLGSNAPLPGQLMSLEDVVTLPDFDYAARMYMNASAYSYYRTGTAGEFGYRANLETFPLVTLRPRILNDVTPMKYGLNTTILGYNFSAPFFISPAANAGLANPNAELGLVEGAGKGNILYIPSLFATLSIPQIAAAKLPGQITFQQLYVRGDKKTIQTHITAAEKAGSKAIVFSVDNAWDPTRSRSGRWSDATNTYSAPPHTWALYDEIQNMTKLPVIPKGIQTVEDALLAIEHNAPAIYLSNHGSRQLDTAQTVMEIALEIYDNAPEVFQKVEVLADSGVRYGTDVIKLLSMGVKAVGLGRPFMYANCYGAAGVEKLIDLLKLEIISDTGNLGVAHLADLNTSHLNLQRLRQYGYKMGA